MSVSQSFLSRLQGGGPLIGTAKALPGGVCGISGHLQLGVPISPLDPSLEGVVLAAQAVFVSTVGEIVAGPSGHAVLLDAASVNRPSAAPPGLATRSGGRQDPPRRRQA